jgi:hypothetical protein
MDDQTLNYFKYTLTEHRNALPGLIRSDFPHKKTFMDGNSEKTDCDKDY